MYHFYEFILSKKLLKEIIRASEKALHAKKNDLSQMYI